MFDMLNMMNKVKDVQAKVKEVQVKLEGMTVVAESGAGMVKATANGSRKIQDIQIDESLLYDKEMMKDLIIAAVNKALEDAEELSKSEIQKETNGMMPNIPGLDLSKFGLGG